MIIEKFMDSFNNWTRGDVQAEDFAESPYWIKNNKKIAKRLLSKNPDLLEFFSSEIQDNWELVSIAVKKYPSTIEFASERLRNDITISKMILEENPFCLSVVSKEIQNDEEFIRELLIREPEVILMVTNEKLLNDKDLILDVIEKRYFLYENIALLPIGKDEDVILKAINGFNKYSLNSNSPFNHIPKSCKSNPRIVIEALKDEDLNNNSLIFFKNDNDFEALEPSLLIEKVAYKIVEDEISITSKNLAHLVLNLKMQKKYNIKDLLSVDDNNKGFTESQRFCEKIVVEKELSLMVNENQVSKTKRNKVNKF